MEDPGKSTGNKYYPKDGTNSFSLNLNSAYYTKLNERLATITLVGFNPTKNDLERTEELASKNRNIAFLTALLLGPFVGVYTGRILNTLKILGIYLAGCSVIGFTAFSIDEELYGPYYDAPTPTTDFVAGILSNFLTIPITIETLAAINKAKTRVKEKEDEGEDLLS